MGMDIEQTKTLEALQMSIQMEIDGGKFYKEASQRCEIKVSRDLYEWLSEQEDWHRQEVEAIYKLIQEKKDWPSVDVIGGRKKGNAAEIFARVTKSEACEIKATGVELEILTKAMEIEDKTRVFYKKQGEMAAYEAPKKFFKTLSDEEHGHYLTLVDYREYLTNPVDWLTKTEHHSLDGG